jgi:hypothetical protein
MLAARSNVATRACRRDAALQTVLRMLLRTSACAAQHVMARRLHAPLPLHWSPFAWLALCHEATQGRSALRGMAGRVSIDGAVGSASAAPRGSGALLPMHACFLESDNDEGEWSMVQVRALWRHVEVSVVVQHQYQLHASVCC